MLLIKWSGVVLKIIHFLNQQKLREFDAPKGSALDDVTTKYTYQLKITSYNSNLHQDSNHKPLGFLCLATNFKWFNQQ